MSGIWMYRKGEAKLFASPNDIPANEGWRDSPAAGEDAVVSYDVEADEERQRVVTEDQAAALEKSGVKRVRRKAPE